MIILAILVGIVFPACSVGFLRWCFPAVNIVWWVTLMFGTGWAIIGMAYMGTHTFP
jgi:hypothetical protein